MVKRKKDWAAYRGKFPSLKLGRMVLWKSYLLRDYLYLLEFDAEVLSYDENRLEVKYTCAGQPQSFTADLVVQRQDTRELIQLTRDESESPRKGSAPQLRTVPALPQGYELRVVTEANVRRQPRLNNIKILWRYAHTPVSNPAHQLLCLDYFRGIATARLGELIDFFRGRGLTEREVFSLIFHRFLFANLNAPLTRITTVSLPKGAETSWKEASGCRTTD
jgi:hypothetical protein